MFLLDYQTYNYQKSLHIKHNNNVIAVFYRNLADKLTFVGIIYRNP